MGLTEEQLQKLLEKQQFMEQCYNQKMAAKYGPNWQMLSSMASKIMGSDLWAACEQEWENLSKSPQQKFVDDCVNQHMSAEFGPNWAVGLSVAQSMPYSGQASWLVQQHAKWLAHCQQMWADAQQKGVPAISTLKDEMQKALGGSSKQRGGLPVPIGALIGAIGLLLGGLVGFTLNTDATFPDNVVVPEGFSEMCPCTTPEPTEDEFVAITLTPTPPNLSLPVNPLSSCGDGVCDPASENSDLCPADCPCVDDGVCRPGEGSTCLDCGSAAGSCGAACSDSSQCAGGLSCASGVCWDACACGGDCPTTGGDQGGGPACGPADRVCPPGCSARLDPDC